MDTDQVKQILEAHDARITELINQVQTQASKLAAVETDRSTLIAALGAATDAINKPSTTNSSTTKPKAVLPDTEKFAGTALTWDTWHPSIQAKLRVDGAALGGSEAQFFYVYSRLESKVQALIMPQLSQAEDSKIYNPQEIISQLARLYDDPHKVREAEDKLQVLKMGDSDHLSAFLAKFERLLYTAKANKWGDNTKIAILRRALNRSVRNKLDTQIMVPGDYDAFVKMLLQLAGAHTGSGYFGNPSHGSSSHYNNNKGGNGDAMDVSTIATIGALDLHEGHWRGEHKDLPTPSEIAALFKK